ncbi:hypothetical protein [Haploplasma axanthum]|uniref:Acid-resistance membrane protein n=1 Tax=Haploplasma axanthum TaxID=29552 RepID=A0A449BFU8_HAPAX|nr:hypothetical protein [Haploplasma axanthum]VEU81313.1 Uncharacterised protein [Haploplasma axanthum]
MKEKNHKVLKVIYWIIAGLFLALGIAFIFDFADDVFGLNLKKIVTGGILITVGCLTIIPILKSKKYNYEWLFIIELIIVIAASTIGFIIPGINKDFGSNLGTPSLWIGLVVAFHAATYLILGNFNEKTSSLLFFLYLVLLFLGGAIVGGNLLDKYINIIIVAGLILIAIYFFLKGLLVNKKIVSKTE